MCRQRWDGAQPGDEEGRGQGQPARSTVGCGVRGSPAAIGSTLIFNGDDTPSRHPPPHSSRRCAPRAIAPFPIDSDRAARCATRGSSVTGLRPRSQHPSSAEGLDAGRRVCGSSIPRPSHALARVTDGARPCARPRSVLLAAGSVRSCARRCANVGNLSLAAMRREPKFAVRAAVGGPRARRRRQASRDSDARHGRRPSAHWRCRPGAKALSVARRRSAGAVTPAASNPRPGFTLATTLVAPCCSGLPGFASAPHHRCAAAAARLRRRGAAGGVVVTRWAVGRC